METDRLDFSGLRSFLRSELGSRMSIQTVSPSTQDIVFVLYDAFVFKAGIGERHNSFGVIMLLPGKASIRTFIGQDTTLCTGKDDARNALRAIDDYCRLRLPDKYLEAFDATVVRSSALDKPSKFDE
jgi:hypothetical protein